MVSDGAIKSFVKGKFNSRMGIRVEHLSMFQGAIIIVTFMRRELFHFLLFDNRKSFDDYRFHHGAKEENFVIDEIVDGEQSAIVAYWK